MKKLSLSLSMSVAASAVALVIGVSSSLAAHAVAEWPWSTPVNITSAEFPYDNVPANPLMIDSQGRMMVVWKTVDNNNYRMASRTSLNGVDWTEPEYFTPANKDVSNAVLAVGNAGRITSLWLDYSGNDPIIWSNTFDGVSWLPAVRVTPNEGRYDNLAIVADSTGLVTALWENQGACSIDSSTSTDGQSWTPAVPVTTDVGRCPWAPQIVVDDSNRLTAIWNADDGQVTEYIVVEASTSTTPGSWSFAEVLSTVGEDARESTLATTSDGLAVAAWKSEQGTGPQIKSRSSQSGATWSPLVSHGSGDGGGPGVFTSPSGTVLLSWLSGTDGSDGVRVTSSQDGASWTSPVKISAEGDYAPFGRAQLSEDACGQIVATWTGSDAAQSTFFVQSSTSVNGLDWSAPLNPASAYDMSINLGLVEDAQGRVTALWYGVNLSDFVFGLQVSNMTKSACASLADTGADASVIGTNLALSAGLLAAGVVAVGLMRRRQLVGVARDTIRREL